jgi:hypothetical protein
MLKRKLRGLAGTCDRRRRERVDAAEEALQQLAALRGALDLRHVAAALEHDLLGRANAGGMIVSCEPQTKSAGASSCDRRP